MYVSFHVCMSWTCLVMDFIELKLADDCKTYRVWGTNPGSSVSALNCGAISLTPICNLVFLLFKKVCVHTHMSVGALRGQKRAPDSLELQETQLGSSGSGWTPSS